MRRSARLTKARADKAVVVEGLGLARVLALLATLGCGAVEIPEDAPPRVEEAGRLANGDLLLPSNLR